MASTFYKVIAIVWLLLLTGGFVYTVEAVAEYGTRTVTGGAVGFFILMALAGGALFWLLNEERR